MHIDHFGFKSFSDTPNMSSFRVKSFSNESVVGILHIGPLLAFGYMVMCM